MHNPSDLDRIRNSEFFDPDWYRNRYYDVTLLQTDPGLHFLNYGRLLERSPSPRFDTRYYLSHYRDVGQDNPLLHYLKQADDSRHRPVTPGQARQILKDLDDATRAVWQPTPPETSRTQRPIISYCIPLKGRLSDIQGTLPENLAEHHDLADKVEFVVILFSDDGEADAWISDSFPTELKSGLLRVVHSDDLDGWHFGKAKNAFRAHILGEVYSSLDGDNFVTREETERLLQVQKDFTGGFVLHHFSGQWGDGTSGRVSLPAGFYREIGYDSAMMPRQFDELDMILRALHRFPQCPFLCLHADTNIFTKSMHARSIRDNAPILNMIAEIEDYARRAPMNPRGDGYAQETPHYSHMGNVNAGLCALALTEDPKRRNAITHQLQLDKHRMMETLPREVILDTFFRAEDQLSAPEVGPLPAFIVVKNEAHFLPSLIRHYRDRGVSSFFIVDDGSTEPVGSLLTDPDVHVFYPKIGGFRNFKTLWIEALMRYFLAEGTWAFTIDADEFIHLPPDFRSFPDLTRHLDTENQDFLPGLMLDLVPGPGLSAEQLANAEQDFTKLFTHCANFTDPVSEDYRNHSSIAWAFGPHAAISWRIDLRYHAFGTVDSMRKIPLLRHQRGRHLNQGFHTLHESDGHKQPGQEIWERRPILPVYHYKLVRLFSEKARAQMMREAANYHDRTKSNITKIFGEDSEAAASKLDALRSHIVPVQELHEWLASGHQGHIVDAL